ncbi:MAG: accessory factor UbiK family protein [Hyphomicrobiales bacterium]
MTQTTNRIFDELAKVLTNAAGAAQGVRGEVETMFKNQAERILNDLDVVKREEFDVVHDMASKAREENERLAQRVAELETELAALKPKPKRAPAKRTPAKRTTGAKPKA